MDTTELEDLEQLVAMPGWRRFSKKITETDLEFLSAVERLVKSEVTDQNAIQDIRSMAAVRDSRREVLSWPEERIKYLRRLLEKR